MTAHRFSHHLLIIQVTEPLLGKIEAIAKQVAFYVLLKMFSS